MPSCLMYPRLRSLPRILPRHLLRDPALHGPPRVRTHQPGRLAPFTVARMAARRDWSAHIFMTGEPSLTLRSQPGVGAAEARVIKAPTARLELGKTMPSLSLRHPRLRGFQRTHLSPCRHHHHHRQQRRISNRLRACWRTRR